MVYGDRAESVVAGFVCVNLNIPLCHFQGGDLSGNIDEKFRHIWENVWSAFSIK